MEQQWSVVEDLDLVMAMYNLIEYSSHYSETKMNFWFDSKDEAINFNDEIENKNNFKSIDYKPNLLRYTPAKWATSISRNATIPLLLKKVSNIWRLLEMLLIKCKVQ